MPSQDDFPPGYDPQKDKIEIVDYDPNWLILYAKEEVLIRKALSPVAELYLEHFGSTSVPGLAAKPVIDIMVGVRSKNLWPSLIEPIKGLGYVTRDENAPKDEIFFVKGMPPYGEKRTHHVHVHEYDTPRWKKELLFRDYLRTHDEAARQYEELKRRLATQFTYDREAYTDAKTDFILEVLQKIIHQ